MKARSVWAALALAFVSALDVAGQSPVISSFAGNGRLVWTNEVNTNALYRVEWAASAEGPWRETFQGLRTLDALTGTAFSVDVPMFFRVVMETNPPPIGMVWVDGGDVELGQSGIAVPVHTNFVSGSWMDAMEVSKAKWDDVYLWATNNGYVFDNAGSAKAANHPVHTVNWYDCVKWCNARSAREGLRPCYYLDPAHVVLYTAGTQDVANGWVDWNANGYRLPTEAEWEKAARGGRQGRLFPWGGDTVQHAQANYFATNSYSYDISPTMGYHPTYMTGGTPYTSPVGSFAANGYGLYDMAGNVFEWCWDWFADYSAAYQVNPRGPDAGQYGANRVLRSGAWSTVPGHIRAARRGSDSPDYESNFHGFRCVRGR